MKLQKLRSRTEGDKSYYKYIVNLPPTLISQMGWNPGDELAWRVTGKSVQIERVVKEEEEAPAMAISPAPQ